MRLHKPHLILSLFLVMFIFISCSLMTEEKEDAQITISLPLPSSRAAGGHAEITEYLIHFLSISEEYSDIAQAFFLGKNYEKFTEQERETYRNYLNINIKSLSQDETISPRSTYSTSLPPGEWLVDIYGLNENHESIYNGRDIVTLQQNKNTNIHIVMRKMSYGGGDGGISDPFSIDNNSNTM